MPDERHSAKTSTWKTEQGAKRTEGCFGPINGDFLFLEERVFGCCLMGCLFAVC